MHRTAFRLSPGLAPVHRVTTRVVAISGAHGPGAPPRRLLGTSPYLRHKGCAKSDGETTAQDPPQPMISLGFWSMKSGWKRASINTLRCLVGCTTGDFAALWFLQAFYADLGMTTIMAVSMISGLTTSMILETTLLRFSRDSLPWGVAARTAAGMSFISMLTMETVQNLIDYHLTGGVVDVSSPSFWAAAALSMGSGYLAPLPYNYVLLRKYGKVHLSAD